LADQVFLKSSDTVYFSQRMRIQEIRSWNRKYECFPAVVLMKHVH